MAAIAVSYSGVLGGAERVLLEVASGLEEPPLIACPPGPLADAARAAGVALLTGTRVTGIELGADRQVAAVQTDQGRIETEVVVNACGIWAPQVAAMVGFLSAGR